jgi:hypothetical protein
MAHITVADEQYIFKPEARVKVYYLLGAGLLLFILGLVLSMTGVNHHEGSEHPYSGVSASHELVATEQHDASVAESQVPAEHGEHTGSPIWLKRVWTTLWMNNIYFIGIGLIGLFFVAIQYAAQAGWSAGLIRVPLAMAQWLAYAGILTLILWFLVRHDVFHWTHSSLYAEGGSGFDEKINKKGPFFYWPLESGSFPLFYILRMLIFFGMWYWFFLRIKRNMLAEDTDPSTTYWSKNKRLSALFLVFFAISSSVAAWDWVMSIDTHWFSTMFGWYVFASWWVTGLAFITLVVAHLKGAGYLKIVNANHLHDLGKFIFAFSIFWTYIWFSQFLLIYYANIPEETVYFIERKTTSPYGWIFYATLIMNFVLPFLLFMTRDAKRQLSTIKLVCPVVLIGHWFDFYNMVTPGVMQENGGLGFLEIGAALIFLAGFFMVMLSSLSKMPLIGKNHPMLEESLHHHI